MKPRRRFYLIPLSLVDLVFRERLFREFQLFITLKARSNGHLKITPEVVHSLATDLGISAKTVKRSLEKLRRRNWIGYNPKSGYSFIRSFETIRTAILKQSKDKRKASRLAVWLDIDKIKECRGFIQSAMISVLIRAQRIKAKKEAQAAAGGTIKEGTFQPARLPSFFPISCQSLSIIYGISTKAAWIAKNNAAAGNFIEIKHVKERLAVDKLQYYLRAFPEDRGKVFRQNGHWYLRRPDLIKTNLLFKRRERLRAQSAKQSTNKDTKTNRHSSPARPYSKR
jgi:DNA-binding transcriptional regulator YhcF (GntR family)